MSGDDSLDLLVQSVRLRAPRHLPHPYDGESLVDFSLRCAEIGALLAVESVSALTLAHLGRLANAAEDRLPVVATVASAPEQIILSDEDAPEGDSR